MPPLRDPVSRYRHLADELAWLRSTPPRKGRKQERARRIADTRRAMGFAADAMRDECKRSWMALDDVTKVRMLAWWKRYQRKPLEAV